MTKIPLKYFFIESCELYHFHHTSRKKVTVVILHPTTGCRSCTISVKKTVNALQVSLCLSLSTHHHLSLVQAGMY